MAEKKQKLLHKAGTELAKLLSRCAYSGERYERFALGLEKPGKDENDPYKDMGEIDKLMIASYWDGVRNTARAMNAVAFERCDELYAFSLLIDRAAKIVEDREDG